MIGLDQSAVVYTAAPVGGAYTVMAATGIACRVCHLDTPPGDAGDERAELSSRRYLLYAAGYTMPSRAQIEVAGQRWNVIEGSAGGRRGPLGTVVYNRCELARAE